MRQRVSRGNWFSRVTQKVFIEQKLNNPAGYVIFIGLAAIFGYLIANQAILGFGLFGLVVSLAVVILCLLNTEAGMYANLIYSFLGFHFSRWFFHDTFPVGVGSDVLVVATFLSLFIGKKKSNTIPMNGVVIWLLILYGYIVLEAFNPYAHSMVGWYTTIRKIIAEFLLLYISYNVFVSFQPVRRFIIVLFVMCSLCGLYGCIQQWHGLFGFEMAWVTSDAHLYGLIFINGDFRKFSTMSDPTAYAIVMASCALFFAILSTRIKKWTVKGPLFLGVLFMIMGMGYSGTRTSNVMLVAGFALFILLSVNNKNTRVFAVIASSIFLLLLYGPYSNRTINRFRTTFLGSQDESYKVRLVNKARIQPYIYAHPIGGGLGTTGAAGLQNTPGHELAGFPPDSGYLKMALEMGWIGLAIICFVYFSVLKVGIRAYFGTEDEHLKTIYSACLAAFFSFYIAQFAQDAIGQITDIVVYYPLISIVLRADTFNKELETQRIEKLKEKSLPNSSKTFT